MVNAQKTPSGALPADFFRIGLGTNFYGKAATSYDITTLNGYKLYQLRTAYATNFGTLYNSGTPRYVQFGVKLYFLVFGGAGGPIRTALFRRIIILMRFPRLAAALVIAVASSCAADAPLPVLRTEPTGGGSIFFVKNTGTQPLTAYLIELVNYPGSSYTLWQDEINADPIAPGAEKRIPVTNMTVGAVPDYVKLQAALFADGSSAGVPERVAQFIARRRAILATTRELIQRLEKSADLKQWSESLQSAPKPKRDSQESHQPGRHPRPHRQHHLRPRKVLATFR